MSVYLENNKIKPIIYIVKNNKKRNGKSIQYIDYVVLAKDKKTYLHAICHCKVLEEKI